MVFWVTSSFIALLIVLHLASVQNCLCDCDYFRGSWKRDSSYPLYNATACPFMENRFNCQKNGRRDLSYLRYKWQPSACQLPRFNGRMFLKRFEGKSIMFVGDTLSRNQWQSLTCLLYTAVPKLKYTLNRIDTISTFTLTDYRLKVMYDRSEFLVDIVWERTSKILKLDSIEGGSKWRGIDMLIFNTFHSWNRRGISQEWDYIQLGNQVVKDMNRTSAFEQALTTWGRWVDLNVVPNKTVVFFQGISPTHYNGLEWKQTKAKNCKGQKTPVSGSKYPGRLPPAVGVVKEVLRRIRKPVILLDITVLSQLRKDGHPSIYGFSGPRETDCTHWCTAGVPDTWNQILFNLIFKKRSFIHTCGRRGRDSINKQNSTSGW